MFVGEAAIIHSCATIADIVHVDVASKQTIEFRNQQVYVNGELLHEPYIKEPCNPAHCPDAVYQLAEDEYFLMGDNRNRSSDSRVFEKRQQSVKREHIVGEVIIRYWPPADWGLMSKIGYPGD